MSGNYYTLEELEVLQSWLSKKLLSMGDDLKTGDQYSEANLSKGILMFIQFLINKELNSRQLTPFSPYMPDPHTYYPPYTTTTTTAPPKLAIDSSIQPVCSECRAKDPNLTVCIHRIVLNTSNTTGE